MTRVLDDNHGIEKIYHGSREVYIPWYTKIIRNSRYGYVNNYYTRNCGWKRVEYPTWRQAYNHVARSRRMPTLQDKNAQPCESCGNPASSSGLCDDCACGPWYHPNLDVESQYEWDV